MIEGLGTTVDVVLTNGVLKEGATVVLAGLQGPVVSKLRAVVTPQPMKELRVKGQYVHHKEIKAAMGVKLVAEGLEHVVAGTQMFIKGPEDDVEELQDEVMSEMKGIINSVDRSG